MTLVLQAEFSGVRTEKARGPLRSVSAQRFSDSVFLRLVHVHRVCKRDLSFIRLPKRKSSLGIERYQELFPLLLISVVSL